MWKFLNIINLDKTLVDRYGVNPVDVFFWVFLISFFIDRVFNYFVHFSFFVATALLLFPFLFFIARQKIPDKHILNILVFSFFATTILNSIIYLFSIKNISDLLFIVVFITVYFLYRGNSNSLKLSNVYLFLVLSVFLFSFTFFEMDSRSYTKTEHPFKLNRSKSLDEKPAQKIETKTFKWKQDPLDVLEYLREYHNGLFRLPHVASYFFGFLALFFAFQYQKRKNAIYIALLIISLGSCIYTGSRTILAAFILSMFVFLFKRKYIVHFILLMAALVLLVSANDYILQMTKGTVFYQYFALIKTTLENFTRLSRFRIWYSWWIEVREFNFLDLMIGKSYANALIANAKNLNYKVWFHNDFLNIFYTYGIWCTALYIWFFVKIYRDNKSWIKQNIFISIFYNSMVITAILNGFYYYFPVFLLYLFFLMINEEQKNMK